MDSIHETVIWVPPADDHERAEALGLVQGGRLEYESRVARVRAMCDERGVAVVICSASPEEVLDTLAQHGLDNDQEGRAAAFALIAQASR